MSGFLSLGALGKVEMALPVGIFVERIHSIWDRFFFSTLDGTSKHFCLSFAKKAKPLLRKQPLYEKTDSLASFLL